MSFVLSISWALWIFQTIETTCRITRCTCAPPMSVWLYFFPLAGFKWHMFIFLRFYFYLKGQTAEREREGEANRDVFELGQLKPGARNILSLVWWWQWGTQAHGSGAQMGCRCHAKAQSCLPVWFSVLLFPLIDSVDSLSQPIPFLLWGRRNPGTLTIAFCVPRCTLAGARAFCDPDDVFLVFLERQICRETERSSISWFIPWLAGTEPI